jgi:hypothetical protein
MSGTTYTCESCRTTGLSESLAFLLIRPDLQGWKFIHFNNEAGRRPTIVCTACFAGYDIAFLSSRITKRVSAAKVIQLMREAMHMFTHMNSGNPGLLNAIVRFNNEQRTS